MNTVWLASGLDPSAAAGFMADQQAVHASGARAMGVVTVVTAQNRAGVHASHAMPLAWIRQQWLALHDLGLPSACKLGLTGTAETLAWLLQDMQTHAIPVIVDPVWRASSGEALVDSAWRETLLQHAAAVSLLTPNLTEVGWLLGQSGLGRDEAAACLYRMGFERVLIKGGHGHGSVKEDCLYQRGERLACWQWPALPGQYRGTGCRLASAIAGHHARGLDWQQAVTAASRWLHEQMRQAVPVPGEERVFLFPVQR